VSVRVLAVAGSLRAASSSAELLRALAKLAPDGVEVEVYDRLGEVPIFSPDLDGEVAPPAVADFRARLRAADAVVLCTPEYAFGMPGLLKNALDWLVSSGETYEKPVAALSCAPSHGGGANALAWLRQTLGAVSAVVPEAASFPIPFVRKRVAGGAVTDPELAAMLRGALAALAKAAEERRDRDV
jgi:NAD(P)H-dependent FMN reductase